MDYFLLINIFAELLICSGYMIAYNRRAFRMVEAAFRDIPPEKIVDKDVSMESMQDHITASTWFIMISGVILTAGFVALFFIQYNSSRFPPQIEALISSGIHTPILFLSIGFIIKTAYSVYTKKTNNTSLLAAEMKTIVTLMAVILDTTLIVLDLSLYLFVTAIILGKYIWIDFIFDGKALINQIKSGMNTLKSGESVSVEFLCFNYAAFFIISFFMTSLTYIFLISKIPSTSTKIVVMLALYNVLVAGGIASLNGLDRVV